MVVCVWALRTIRRCEQQQHASRRWHRNWLHVLEASDRGTSTNVSRIVAPLNIFYCALLATLFITFTEKWYLIWKCVWINRNTTHTIAACLGAWLLNGIRIKWGEIAFTICAWVKRESGLKQRETEMVAVRWNHLRPSQFLFVSLFWICATINFHWIFIQSETVFSSHSLAFLCAWKIRLGAVWFSALNTFNCFARCGRM